MELRAGDSSDRAGALLDRLTHRVHILELNGESYRFKDSIKRQGRRKALIKLKKENNKKQDKK